MIIIEFDGGTPCNIPSEGYGIGYGSFKIDDLPIEKVDHGRSMSANVAEIMTAVVALEKVRALFGPSEILVRGDSRIALKWIEMAHRPKKKAISVKNVEAFKFACEEAFRASMKHKKVKTEWRGREHSVTLFGH